MRPQETYSACRIYDLGQMFEPPAEVELQQVLDATHFKRARVEKFNEATIILDTFPGAEGISCCFIRLSPSEASTARFVVHGGHEVESSLSGGWKLKSVDAEKSSYWIPQAPVHRKCDSNGRILAEELAPIVRFDASSNTLAVEFGFLDDHHLDLTLWCFPSREPSIQEELERSLNLEKQRVYLWNSQTTYQTLADVYSYLIHGHVYTDRFVWPRNWKIFSELDAYGLYVTLNGLEIATQKKIYDLIKRQLVYSVIARQDQDGGWYHGEWTDLMESHYRFHNGALLLLEAAVEEWRDDVISNALQRGVSFISRATDKTDFGLWFLHDSLEDSVEGMNANWKQTGGRWIPNRLFGKSETNKLVLNTHLDAIIALDRYREVTGDEQYTDKVDSALATTRSLLALRPGEQIYRLAYWAIGLTLLPVAEAKSLPLPVRAIKRLTWAYLVPHMYRLKRAFPRFVMPNGLIERHLSMPHCDFNYPAVNVMDLSRLWRLFPKKDLGDLLAESFRAVEDTSIMKYWVESRVGNFQQFAAVVWVEALYRMCMLSVEPVYRRYLAEAMLCVEDADLGLPPSLLGADPEAVMKETQVPCPSPANDSLCIANLSYNGRREFLVVNGTAEDIDLTWEGNADSTLTWVANRNHSVSDDNIQKLYVPSRGWLWGQGG